MQEKIKEVPALKYPAIEKIIEIELPQEKKEEIAKIIFKGQLEMINSGLKGIGLTLGGEIDKALDESDYAVERAQQNSEQPIEMIMSHFNKIREALLSKFKELLLTAKDNEVEDVKNWYKQERDKINNLHEETFNEIIKSAERHLNETIEKFKGK